MDRMFLKGIFGAECVMTMIVAALMAFGGVGRMEAKALSGADGVRTAVSAAEGSADGVGARKAATRSGSYPWEGKEVVEVGDAVALSSALGNDGNKGKVIILMDVIMVDGDITSSIDASIDLNGNALNFLNFHSSINVTGGCLNIYDSSGTASSIDVNDDNAKGFVVNEGATLNIYAGVFTGGGKSTAIYNAGAVNVYGGTFSKFIRAIDNAGTLTIEGGNFVGKGGVTGIYNRNVATVSGGTFKSYIMGIYNVGTLKLLALPTFGTGNDANATADIGLKAGKVITMAGEISSLPADYVKIKVGQFSYSESSGYDAAGSVPYVVTSGYKDKVKGIHPAMMFQAYDPDPSDNEYYEFCAKSGSGTDVGEAQIVEADGSEVTWTNPDNSGGSGPISEVLINNQEWADGAVIRLNRNVDIGEYTLVPSSSNGWTSFTLDLNGHLLTGSPNTFGILYVNELNVTICDSGEGGMIAVNSGNSNCAVRNYQGSLTITGGSFFSESDAIYIQSGTLTVTGGTFTGGGRAVYNGSQGTATISGGTFIGVTGGSSPIYNEGTMRLGCGSGAVTVLGGGGSSAIGNRGALTVGENVTITSGEAAGIYNPGTLTVAGFPTFDAGNACDIRLEQASNGSNTFISFTADIPGGPANPINIKIEDINGNPVTPGTSGLTLTSGYAAHVKRGGTGADKDRPQEPGLVFTVLGVADGTYLLLSGGEAVAYAGSFPVAEVKSGDDTYTYNIGTGALGLSTAAGALVQAVYAADRVDDDTTVKMLCDVDLGTAWLDFRTFTSAVGVTPENAKKMTLDLNGFELSGCQINVIDNSVYSLTVVNTGTDGGILQYGADGACIYNDRELTVKGVTLRATGVSCYRIYNFGTLTIDGEMKFLGSVDANDVYLAYGKTLGIGESLNLSAKLKVYVEDATIVPRKLTTGYGKTVRTPATATTTSKVKAPDEVFTVTNIGTNKLAFAGGEAWVVADGTLALIQTATAVNAYSNVDALYNDVETLTDDATVMLADDVDIKLLCLQFLTAGKLFTLDLGGHTLIGRFTPLIIVEGGALLDIIDSGGSGLIKSPGDGFEIIRNDASTLSIVGALTIEHIGTNTKGIRLKGGTTTLKGWPAFNRGEDAGSNIYLENGALISFTDDISAAPAQKISVTYKGDNLGTLTSGYGAHVKYPTGHEKAGKPIDPEEVFTYMPYGTPVASVHPRLVGTGDAVEAEFWMPHQKVAYIDAAGDLHDDLTDSTPQTTDDGHDAYILDGTEKTLGKSGTDTWYVAQGTLNYAAIAGSTDARLKIEGDVHLILADGAAMTATGKNGISCNYQDNLTIYGQSSQTGALTAVSNVDDGTAIQINRGDLVINGGQLTLSAPGYGNGISLSNGNLTVNGGSILADIELYIYNGNATINGGEFNTSSVGLLDVLKGDITINGGSFYKYDIIAKGSVGTGGNVTFNGGIFEGGNYDIYGTTSTTVTGGNLQANLIGRDGSTTILGLKTNTDFVSSAYVQGTVTVPQGIFITDHVNTYGSLENDYIFGAPGNFTNDDLHPGEIVKAKPIAGSGKYLAYDCTDADWLLSYGTVALYPTAVKFIDNNDGTYMAEVILSTTALAGVPSDRAVILANENVGDPLGDIFLWGMDAICPTCITPQGIEDDYDSRTDRLKNFIATDGAKTFSELIGEAAGATVSTAEQARDYLVFTLTGDRFVPITFAYDDTPAAGHCLLVVPKINILLHEDIPAPAGGSSSGARRISLGGGESAATGVNGVIGVGEAKDDTYFGLDGRRLSGRPSQKGVYIRGGSKVVIR